MKITLDLSWDDACTLDIYLPVLQDKLEATAAKRKLVKDDYLNAARCVGLLRRQLNEQLPDHRPK